MSESKILRLYSIVHVAMETTKTSNFTCQSKSFISIFFTCQVSACGLQPFSCHDLANDIYSQTAKTVLSHLKNREWAAQDQVQEFRRTVAVAVAAETITGQEYGKIKPWWKKRYCCINSEFFDFELRYLCNNYGGNRVHDTVQVHKPRGQLNVSECPNLHIIHLVLFQM